MKVNKKLVIAVFIAAASLVSFTQTQGQNIYTIAGSGTPPNNNGFSGDGGLATACLLNNPGDVSVDDSGNVYIADENNERIRKINVSTGIITTIAGNGNTGYTGDGGAATNAEMNIPYGIAIDDSDNVYFADGMNNVVRKITVSTGIITTIAGVYALGAGYNGDGIAATSAQLYQPSGIAFDDTGNLFIADFRNQRVREIRKATGIISTVAGNGVAGYIDNVAATASEIYYTAGVALDDSNNIYIADAGNNRVRKITAKTGIISTIAGTGTPPNNYGYNGDGTAATTAVMDWSVRLAVDDSGNVIICDEYNEALREIAKATGIITTTAGTGYGQGSLNGGYNGDNIPATTAELWAPGGVAVDNCGNLYIADDYNNRVREVVNAVSHSISITPPALSTCSGSSNTLRASGAGIYTWAPATGLSATTGAVVIANPTITTTYTITGGNTACAGIATVVITVNAAPPLIINPPSPAIECNGEGIVLTVPASGSDYVWSPATGLSATTGSTVTANPTADITYTVTGLDSLGCAVTDSEVINIQLGPSKPIITVSVTGDTLISSAINGNQWFVNGTAIHGATDSIFVIKGLPNNDTITVSVTNVANGCSTTSDLFITGINPLAINSRELSIYPNPANGFINVNISSSAIGVKDWTLQFTDVLGRMLFTKSSLNYNNMMDVTGLPGGVYFIIVANKTGRVVAPFVKQ